MVRSIVTIIVVIMIAMVSTVLINSNSNSIVKNCDRNHINDIDCTDSLNMCQQFQS